MFKSVLVYASYSDLEARENYETAVVRELRYKGVHSYRAMDIFSPLKKYTDSEREAIAVKTGYDLFLYLSPNGSNTTTQTEIYNNWYGGVSADSYQSLSDVYFHVTLFERNKEEKIYDGSISSALSKYAVMSTVRASMSEKLVDDLFQNKYLLATDPIVEKDDN